MGTIDAIIEGAKTLKEAGKINEYKQILELLEERSRFLNEINDLKVKSQQLTEKLKNKEEISKGPNCYIGKDGTYYCMRCFDKNQELIRLKDHNNRSKMDCPECKNFFRIDGRPDTVQVFRPRTFLDSSR